MAEIVDQKMLNENGLAVGELSLLFFNVARKARFRALVRRITFFPSAIDGGSNAPLF
jgi:hypothetical protein